jgi:RNA polymerase sigma-70 factor, ECF subfamily
MFALISTRSTATVTNRATRRGRRYSDAKSASGNAVNRPQEDGFPGFADANLLEERFLGRLRWFAAHWLGDVQAGEDVAQEALKRVLQALAEGRIRNPQALPAFVYQTARHVCSHKSRSAGRERRMLARYGREPSVDEPVADPLAELVSDERKAAVRGALAALDAEDRDLLSALYVHEQSPRQLAARLRLSDGALRTRKHRALKRLGEQLAARERPA